MFSKGCARHLGGAVSMLQRWGEVKRTYVMLCISKIWYKVQNKLLPWQGTQFSIKVAGCCGCLVSQRLMSAQLGWFIEKMTSTSKEYGLSTQTSWRGATIIFDDKEERLQFVDFMCIETWCETLEEHVLKQQHYKHCAIQFKMLSKNTYTRMDETCTVVLCRWVNYLKKGKLRASVADWRQHVVCDE